MGTVENLASVDSRFTIGIRYAGTVADETAFLDVQPINVQGWERMTRCQRNDLLPKAEKDCIGINQKCLSAFQMRRQTHSGCWHYLERPGGRAYPPRDVHLVPEEADGSCSRYEFV